MNKLEYLRDLIKRMNDRTSVLNSGDSSAFSAHREAEKLNDPSLIELIHQIIKNTSDNETKRVSYFILGCLGKNIPKSTISNQVFPLLLEEKDKYVLTTALEGLVKQSNISHNSILLKLINDPRWMVRYAAMQALAHCVSPYSEAENILCNLISKSRDKYDLIYATSTLSKIGGQKSILLFRDLLTHSSQDVKIAAINALKELGGSAQLQSFINSLKEKYFVRLAAIEAIHSLGNKEAFDDVYIHIQNLIKKKRIYYNDYPTELIYALDFLLKYKTDNPSVLELFEKLNTAYKNKLFEVERIWVEDRLKNFDKVIPISKLSFHDTLNF
jgi:HEAT repeat protein